MHTHASILVHICLAYLGHLHGSSIIFRNCTYWCMNKGLMNLMMLFLHLIDAGIMHFVMQIILNCKKIFLIF